MPGADRTNKCVMNFPASLPWLDEKEMVNQSSNDLSGAVHVVVYRVPLDQPLAHQWPVSRTKKTAPLILFSSRS